MSRLSVKAWPDMATVQYREHITACAEHADAPPLEYIRLIRSSTQFKSSPCQTCASSSASWTGHHDADLYGSGGAVALARIRRDRSGVSSICSLISSSVEDRPDEEAVGVVGDGGFECRPGGKQGREVEVADAGVEDVGSDGEAAGCRGG